MDPVRPHIRSRGARPRKPSRRVDSCMARAVSDELELEAIRAAVAVAVEARQPWRGPGQAGQRPTTGAAAAAARSPFVP